MTQNSLLQISVSILLLYKLPIDQLQHLPRPLTFSLPPRWWTLLRK
nr:MAG TPA: hypothetical protein [Caudoviricetes sp.]